MAERYTYNHNKIRLVPHQSPSSLNRIEDPDSIIISLPQHNHICLETTESEQLQARLDQPIVIYNRDNQPIATTRTFPPLEENGETTNHARTHSATSLLFIIANNLEWEASTETGEDISLSQMYHLLLQNQK